MGRITCPFQISRAEEWNFCHLILQFPTLGHDYPVPVDKPQTVVKILPHLPDPLGGVEGQLFILPNSQLLKFCMLSEAQYI